jgi:DNA-binding MarR family transcriptional regulator
MNKAARLTKCKVNQKLSEIGLTFPQFQVIKYLFKEEAGSEDIKARMPAVIAEKLGYDRPTLTGIIDRLEKQRLVDREANPSDRRSQTVTLTQKARNLMPQIHNCFREVNSLILVGFEGEEMKQLQNYLFRIMRNLGEPIE